MSWAIVGDIVLWIVAIVAGAVLVAVGVLAILVVINFAKGLVSGLKK